MPNFDCTICHHVHAAGRSRDPERCPFCGARPELALPTLAASEAVPLPAYRPGLIVAPGAVTCLRRS